MEEYKGFKIPNMNDIVEEMTNKNVPLRPVNPNVTRIINIYRWLDLVQLTLPLSLENLLKIENQEEADKLLLSVAKKEIDEWEEKHGEKVRKKNEEIEKRNLHEYLS